MTTIIAFPKIIQSIVIGRTRMVARFLRFRFLDVDLVKIHKHCITKPKNCNRESQNYSNKKNGKKCVNDIQHNFRFKGL